MTFSTVQPLFIGLINVLPWQTWFTFMQRFVSTLWCQFLVANLFWKSPLSHLLIWEVWKDSIPTSTDSPRKAPVVALPGKVTLPQLRALDGPCVPDPIPSLSLVRQTLTSQSPSLHKASAPPFTANSGTVFTIEMALLSRKTKHYPMKRRWLPLPVHRHIDQKWGCRARLGHGQPQEPSPGWHWWEKSKDITAMPAAPDLLLHGALLPEPRQSLKGMWMLLTTCFYSLKFCSSAAGTAISHTRLKGPAHPLRNRSIHNNKAQPTEEI